jgi:putative MFS transporter
LPEAKTPSGGHVGIAFHRPWAFQIGTLAMVAGVMAHVPMFVHSRHTHYHMAGMPMTGLEIAGMGLIVGGLALAAWGLFPRRGALGARERDVSHGYHIRSMDDAALTRAHWGLLFVLGVALIIDVMKPATLGFVLPGMSHEYGLLKHRSALLLLFALTGTVLGSVLWGVLADHLGRRASILLASLMFIGTSICGFMPSFGWNLLMCFLMGASAGGMLPIVYALMAESVPAKRRGWLVVLHGGMGTIGGTLAAAGAAALLVPTFGWRILWFLGLPTGVLLLVLNRWIPESPRFLLERGRVDEARSVMARYGVVLEETDQPGPHEEELEPEGSRQGNIAALFRGPYVPQTLTVMLYGVAWGLVNWGFIALLPTFLEGAGFSVGTASFLLFLSALLAVPGTIAVAYAYGTWSSRRSMIGFAAATAACLIGFAILNPDAADSRAVIVGLTAILFIASGGVIAMLSPYTAEVYPTHLRGTGSGLAAAGSKLGGLLGAVGSTTGVIALTTSLVTPALLVAAPMAAAAVVIAWSGVETRGRRLEEIALPATESGGPNEGTREREATPLG